MGCRTKHRVRPTQWVLAKSEQSLSPARTTEWSTYHLSRVSLRKCFPGSQVLSGQRTELRMLDLFSMMGRHSQYQRPEFSPTPWVCFWVMALHGDLDKNRLKVLSGQDKLCQATPPFLRPVACPTRQRRRQRFTDGVLWFLSCPQVGGRNFSGSCLFSVYSYPTKLQTPILKPSVGVNLRSAKICSGTVRAMDLPYIKGPMVPTSTLGPCLVPLSSAP